MKVNQLKWGAIISNLQMALGFLISLIYTPLMLRLMGQSEYGLYTLVLSVVSYLGVLNLGFTSAYMRFFSRGKIKDDEQKLSELNGMFLLLFIILGAIVLVAGTILSQRPDVVFGNELVDTELEKASILMIILSANIAFTFTGYIFSSYIRIHERFVFRNVVLLVKTLTQPFVMIPILYMGYGSIGMGIIVSLFNIGAEVAHIIYCFKYLGMKISFKNPDPKLMREMGVYSFYIFLSIVVEQIYNNYGKFILGRIHGTISVAIYGVGQQLQIYYQQIGQSISNVFIPRIHRLVANDDDADVISHLIARVGRIQSILLGLIFLGFIFFGKPFISVWAGNEYLESYYVAILLFVSYTIILLQSIGIEVQRAKNLHKKGTLILLISALFNSILTIPLTQYFDSIGAALATAISIFIGYAIATTLYNAKVVNLNMKFYLSQLFKLLPGFIAPIIFGLYIMSQEMKSIFQLTIFGVAFILLYLISFWLFAMNNYEKDLILKPLSRFIKRDKK